MFNAFDNYTLISENTAVSDELIANTRLQSQYNLFMKNIDEKRMTTRSTLDSDKGMSMKDR